MDRDARLFRYATVLYALAFVVHTSDHFRRGVDSVTEHVFWAGNLAAVIAVVAIVASLAGHRLAPLIAVATGFPLALGYAAVHLLPEWSVFSDSFPSGDVDALSWAAGLLETAGALLFGTAGAYVLRRRGLESVLVDEPAVA